MVLANAMKYLYCIMFLRSFILAIFIFCFGYSNGYAQQNDFCNAINAVTRDAPNQFRNIKGKMTAQNMNATMWASGIVVPGSIGTRFVSAMGLFYECSFFQTTDKELLKPVYEKYKGLLRACLEPQGYTMTQHENFYAGMGDFKKLVFMQDEPATEPTDTVRHISSTLPPHITLEADYNMEVGKFTIVMIIFEH